MKVSKISVLLSKQRKLDCSELLLKQEAALVESAGMCVSMNPNSQYENSAVICFNDERSLVRSLTSLSGFTHTKNKS